MSPAVCQTSADTSSGRWISERVKARRVNVIVGGVGGGIVGHGGWKKEEEGRREGDSSCDQPEL